MTQTNTLPDNALFWQQVLHAERQNPDYDPADIHTFTQETIGSNYYRDLTIHMVSANKRRGLIVCYSTDKMGNNVDGRHNAEIERKVDNSVLRFSKRKFQVLIKSCKLKSVLTPFIVNRYKLYEKSDFNANDLIYAQQTKIFFNPNNEKFQVNLPDHFWDDITPASIPLTPEAFSGSDRAFEYNTLSDLLAQYNKDLKAFASAYMGYYNTMREGQKVILIRSERTHFDQVGIYTTGMSSKVSGAKGGFDGKVIAVKGVIFGSLFYPTDEHDQIDGVKYIHLDQRNMQGQVFDKSGKLVAEACIPYSDEQWSEIGSIIETFQRAQSLMESIILDSHQGSLLSNPLSTHASRQLRIGQDKSE